MHKEVYYRFSSLFERIAENDDGNFTLKQIKSHSVHLGLFHSMNYRINLGLLKRFQFCSSFWNYTTIKSTVIFSKKRTYYLDSSDLRIKLRASNIIPRDLDRAIVDLYQCSP